MKENSIFDLIQQSAYNRNIPKYYKRNGILLLKMCWTAFIESDCSKTTHFVLGELLAMLGTGLWAFMCQGLDLEPPTKAEVWV